MPIIPTIAGGEGGKKDACYLGYEDCYKYGATLKYEDYQFKNRAMATIMTLYWMSPLVAYISLFYPWGNEEYIELMNTRHALYKQIW